MATQCKLCGLHIPDGVQSCMMCGSRNFAVVAAGETITPSLPGAKSLAGPGQAALSKWLWVVAISLVVAPILRVMSIITFEIPTLFGDQIQANTQRHPGLPEFLYFEIGVNILLVVSAIVLNFLFYTKSKRFPIWMVSYVSVTVLFRIATTSVINSMFPDKEMTRLYVELVRMLIWAGALIPYLLTSSDVKTRFVK